MKKKLKIVVGTIAAIFVITVFVVCGFLVWLSHTLDANHEFGKYVVEEGPWGSENTWVSEDSNSYLICKKEKLDDAFSIVTAYFKNDDDWEKYDVNCQDRIIILSSIDKDDVHYRGRMEFDGTVFTIKDLETNSDDKDLKIKKYQYTITNEKLAPTDNKS